MAAAQGEKLSAELQALRSKMLMLVRGRSLPRDVRTRSS